MQIPTPRTRHMLLATLIAATGLPASLAHAQFKVDYGDKDKKTEPARPAPAAGAAQGGEQSQSVVVITSDEGEHAYEVRVVNGVVELARVDGKDIGRDRIKLEGEAIIFLDKDGKTLHEFRVPGAPALPALPSPRAAAAPLPAQPGMMQLELRPSFTWSSDDKDGGQLRVQVVDSQQPKVMLGINLSEPSAALRKQLRLGEDQQVILVERVIKGLPADKAGLEDFDVILSIDGSDQANGDVLREKLADKQAGDTLKLVLLRGGEKMDLNVKLAAYDARALGMTTEPREQEEIELGTPAVPSPPAAPRPGEFRWRSDNQDPHHMQGLHEQMQDAQQAQRREQELAQRMQEKALEAMRDAQRQILEFKDGKLILRSQEDMGRAIDGYRQQLLDTMPSQEEMDQRLGDLEARLGDLEQRLDRQFEQMSGHMERLTAMFERIMTRLQDRADRSDRADQDQD